MLLVRQLAKNGADYYSSIEQVQANTKKLLRIYVNIYFFIS